VVVKNIFAAVVNDSDLLEAKKLRELVAWYEHVP
jgi:hypothetical protein